ncbi:MAG TPA: sodium/solute symporter [Planctomycetota bacterium]|nr:sodium/solute symporter [Planctomycetota bacterium]
MLALGVVDWAVVVAYGAAVFLIGWIAARRQKSSDDFYLGGRRMPWWALGISLIATSFSGVSLIGGTGFGFAPGNGMRWIQLQVGDLLGLGVVMLLFLPFFSGLGITTAYEYLERRFGVLARTAASALFIAQTVARAAVVLLPPAIAIHAVVGWSLGTSIVASTAVAIAYSAFGGLVAVVWTDVLQMIVVLFAVFSSLAIIDHDVPGGLGATLRHARAEGQLETLTLAGERGSIFNLPGALLAYGVLACSLFGTNQQSVQRFLSCRDLRSARRAAILAWGTGTLALFLTLFLGVSLAAWQDLAPDAVPLGEGDGIFPAFVASRLPAGIAGLMLAAVFAASMSSIDSAIHSTSTAFLVDFVRRFARRPLTPRAELVWAQVATVAFGVLATLAAFYAAGKGTGILDLLVTWLGYFAGPLLGLFLLGMLSRRANEGGAIVGVGAAFLGIVGVVLARGEKPWGWHPLWLAPVSTVVTGVVGWAASLLWPPPDPLRLRGLVRGSPAPPD